MYLYIMSIHVYIYIVCVYIHIYVHKMSIVSLFLHWNSSTLRSLWKDSKVLLYPPLPLENKKQKEQVGSSPAEHVRGSRCWLPRDSGQPWARCGTDWYFRLIWLHNKRGTSCTNDVAHRQKRKMYGMYWFWRSKTLLTK